MRPRNNTALLISGRASRIEEDYPSVKQHILDPYHPDVFIETWDSPEARRAIDLYQPVAYHLEDFNTSPAVKDINEFLTANPQPFRDYNGSAARHNNRENVVYMYYKIWKCNQLRHTYNTIHHDQPYETVIRFRFELNIYHFPNAMNVMPDTIHLPSIGDYLGGYCDQIAIADSDSMDRYSDIYPRYKHYYTNNFPFHPESLLRKHLEHEGLHIERFSVGWRLRGKPLP